MTISYLLAPIPKWVLINNQGTVAGGAKLYTFRSLNKTEQKAVFQDPGGTIPWPNPIIFDANGTQGPFYWKVDSANLNDTYYLEAYDADGNELWTDDDYFPPGSGGGGNVTTYLSITNYITNNQFIDHIDDTANPTGVTNLVIAPSNHKGFTPALITPVVGTYGVVGPDIRFIKNAAGTPATDQITFELFPLASAPLTGDVTPVEYIRYQCTNSPVGETYKNFQFPITQKIKNLSNQAMTFRVWAKVTATPVTLTGYIRQYFGSGTAASADARTSIGTMVLTTTWTQYTCSFTVPDVSGESIGTPGQQTNDDAIYIQLEMPLNAPCDVLFTKPKLYLGTIDPSLEFTDYDQINSINSTPRTGDIKTSLLSSAPNGWVAMNDGSIGNEGSLASTRENVDTFQLYKTIWDGVIDAFAPVSTGRGVTAVADFIAGKTLTLPRSLGRALAGAGSGSGLTGRVLGEYFGEESHQLTILEMPSHNHPGSQVALSLAAQGGISAGLPSSVVTTVPTSVTVALEGGGGAHNNMQPTSFMNVFIKL